MIQRYWWVGVFGIAVMSSNAVALDVGAPKGLTAVPPRCKPSAVARPKLPPELGRYGKEAVRTGWHSPLVVDFNGDGWCDFAWAAPYPVNSKMESYFLEDILILGGAKRWRRPHRGRLPAMFSQDAEVWPDFRLDLTEIALVFDLSGGAPYVLGLVSGYDLGKEWHSAGCRQHSSVYRWDDQVDAFKRVDAVERQSVLSYYYTHVEKPCP